MSKAKQIAVVDPTADELEDLTGEEQDIVAAIGELEGSEDARWQVTRVAPLAPGKAGGYCETFASNEISKELIRKTCGKGRYKVRGLRPNGTYLKQFTVEIANDVPAEVREQSPQIRNEPQNFLEMMQLMDERRAKSRNELLAIAAPIIAAAIPSLFGNRGNQTKDLVEMMAAMKAISGDGDSKTAMIDTMFKAMEFGRDSAGGGKETGATWIDLAKDAIQSVGPIIGAKLAQGSAPPQRISVTQAPAPQLAAPQSNNAATPSAQGDDMNMMQAMQLQGWAKQTMTYLTKIAKKNGDPGLYADWVLDNGPPGIDLAPFIEYLSGDNWWVVLQQFDANCAPYEGWFTELRTAILEAWAEIQQPQLQSDTETGE